MERWCGEGGEILGLGGSKAIGLVGVGDGGALHNGPKWRDADVCVCVCARADRSGRTSALFLATLVKMAVRWRSNPAVVEADL